MRSKNKKQLIDNFRQKCRGHNLKMTPQRLAIYEALINSYDHPCADDIFGQVAAVFPDISIDTVYRTIATFSEIGLINTVEGYGEAKRYDPETQQHHHFRCKKCGKIIDFTEESFNRLQAPKKIREKYTVSDLKVVVEGLCEKCS